MPVASAVDGCRAPQPRVQWRDRRVTAELEARTGLVHVSQDVPAGRTLTPLLGGDVPVVEPVRRRQASLRFAASPIAWNASRAVTASKHGAVMWRLPAGTRVPPILPVGAATGLVPSAQPSRRTSWVRMTARTDGDGIRRCVSYD